MKPVFYLVPSLLIRVCFEDKAVEKLSSKGFIVRIGAKALLGLVPLVFFIAFSQGLDVLFPYSVIVIILLLCTSWTIFSWGPKGSFEIASGSISYGLRTFRSLFKNLFILRLDESFYISMEGCLDLNLAPKNGVFVYSIEFMEGFNFGIWLIGLLKLLKVITS